MPNETGMPADVAEKYFTLVFAGNIRDSPANPFKTETPFGTPAACGVGDVFVERDALEAENERLRKALEPFAKAGELFPGEDDDFDQCIYKPAAGDEYALCGNHLRAALKAAMEAGR